MTPEEFKAHVDRCAAAIDAMREAASEPRSEIPMLRGPLPADDDAIGSELLARHLCRPEAER